MKKILFLFNLLVTFFLTAFCQNGIGPNTVKTTLPSGTDNGISARLIPQQIYRTTFAKTLASSWDTDFWTKINSGAGQVNSQASGNGLITSGTTANSETILRSNRSFKGSFLLRAQTILSQRIANNNFYIELADVIGDNLVMTAISATQVRVTIPNNTFTAENVGQAVFIGAINAGTIPGVLIPGRYLIASVSGNDVTFTVAGWTGAISGTGTCSLFGWNYHQVLYTGTTATSISYDCQRRGWNSGYTAATINTTASPGHMVIMGSEDGTAFLSDQLVASAATLPVLPRASRVVGLAEENTPLFLQIRVVNGTTAPASNTTFTSGTISVENYATQPVSLTTAKVQAPLSSLKMELIRSIALSVTATQGAAGATSWLFEQRTGTTNGSTSTAVNSLATNNAAFLKASAGMIYSISANNTTASLRYVRIFNKASAPAMGTDIPMMVITVPAASSKEIWFPMGLKMATGIAYAITGGATANDNTSVSAGDVQLMINWQ